MLPSIHYKKEVIRFHGSPWGLVKKLPLRLKYKFAKGALKVTINPERTEGIFEAVDLVLKHPDTLGKEIQDFCDEFKKFPAINQLIIEKYMEPEVDLLALSKLEDGTVGKEYWRHLDSNNLDAVFYSNIPIENDLQWLSMRSRQIHDLFHIILGFGTSVADELGVQAYGLGQSTDPAAAMIVGGGLLNSGFTKPWTIPECLDAIVRGYQLGRLSHSPLGIKFAEIWDKPLSELRTELGMPGEFFYEKKTLDK